jgi:hypothetical protein
VQSRTQGDYNSYSSLPNYYAVLQLYSNDRNIKLLVHGRELQHYNNNLHKVHFYLINKLHFITTFKNLLFKISQTYNAHHTNRKSHLISTGAFRIIYLTIWLVWSSPCCSRHLFDYYAMRTLDSNDNSYKQYRQNKHRNKANNQVQQWLTDHNNVQPLQH